MPPKMPRKYWDAGVVLSLFDNGSTEEKAYQRKNAALLMQDAEKGNALIITATLTLTEARRGDGNPPLPGEDYATPRAFLKHSYVELVPLDRGTAELAADYADRFHLKNHDAIHLATAVRAKADVFLAWNGDFHKTGNMKGAPIPIMRPIWTGMMQLPLLEDSVIEPPLEDSAIQAVEAPPPVETVGEPPQVAASETAAPSVDGKQAVPQAEPFVSEGTGGRPKTILPVAESLPAEAAEDTIGDKETPSGD